MKLKIPNNRSTHMLNTFCYQNLLSHIQSIKKWKLALQTSLPTHHPSCQNWFCCPSWTLYWIHLSKLHLLERIDFQKINAFKFWTRTSHPSLPNFYLLIRICFHKRWTESPALYNHLSSTALFIFSIEQIPNPPWEIGLQTMSYLTKWYLLLSTVSFQRKSHWNFSICCTTFFGHLKRDRKYIGILERTDLICVTRPSVNRIDPKLYTIF